MAEKKKKVKRISAAEQRKAASMVNKKKKRRNTSETKTRSKVYDDGSRRKVKMKKTGRGYDYSTSTTEKDGTVTSTAKHSRRYGGGKETTKGSRIDKTSTGYRHQKHSYSGPAYKGRPTKRKSTVKYKTGL